MKIILLMAVTADGIIGRYDGSDINLDRSVDDKSHPFNWLSKEDKKYFRTFSKKIGTMIMGSKSYIDAGRTYFKDRLLVVLTSDPAKFDVKRDDVLFLSGEPNQIVDKLKKRGIELALLGGGTQVNSDFLKANLVDEIHLTLEPKIFGRGKRFVDDLDLDINLELISLEKLNEQGTLLLKYKVINN